MYFLYFLSFLKVYIVHQINKIIIQTTTIKNFIFLSPSFSSFNKGANLSLNSSLLSSEASKDNFKSENFSISDKSCLNNSLV